jgi:hypothetical protein
MGAFVVWLAGRYEEMQERSHRRVLEIRSQGQGGAGHARTPAAVAELQNGMEIFLEFAAVVGAIGGAEKEELEGRNGRALGELAGWQAKYQAARDPALRFVALLQAALAGGTAHVADRQGQVPAEAAAWGWQRPKTGRKWVSQGTRIGWVAGNDLYLDPLASYQTAQALAGAERIPVSEQALRHQLRKCGFLAGLDTGRGMLQVRRTLAGRPRQVLHLRASDWRVVTRVSGRRSHRWATQRKRRHLSDLSDVPPLGSPSARIAVVCAVRTGDHQRAHAGQAVGGTAQGQVDGLDIRCSGMTRTPAAAVCW